MTDAAPLKATFFAFRKREKGGVLARASIAYLVTALAIFALFIALNRQLFGPVIDWYFDVLQVSHAGQGEPPVFPQPPPELFMLLPSYLAVLAASCVLLAAYEAACLRWMIRGESGGFFGLSLGADTWRVWFTYWAWLIGLICVEIALVVVVGILMALFAGIGVIVGGGQRGAMLLLPLLLVFTIYGVLIVLAVRTAPAAATAIARRKFSFFKSWAVSRHRFWALFGSFFLLWLIGLIAITIVYCAAFATIFATSDSALRDVIASGDHDAMRQAMHAIFTTPRSLAIAGAFYLVLLPCYFVMYVGMFGVNARAALAALEEGKIAPAG